MTTPHPPGSFSDALAGGGFRMSSTRKIKNPATPHPWRQRQEGYREIEPCKFVDDHRSGVRTPGFFSGGGGTGRPPQPSEPERDTRQETRSPAPGNRPRRYGTIAAAVPAVPGATGTYPEKNPVASTPGPQIQVGGLRSAVQAVRPGPGRVPPGRGRPTRPQAG